MNLIEAAKLALEALDNYVDKPYSRWEHYPVNDAEKAILALRSVITESEKHEPVAWLYRDAYGKLKVCQLAEHDDNDFPVYTYPAPSVPPVNWLAGGTPPKYTPGKSSLPSSSIPEGWIRAIDEAMVCSHLGVANVSDTYEEAKKKLNSLICWNIDIATDPAVNGGWQLVPKVPTKEMLNAADRESATRNLLSIATITWNAMLNAAPKFGEKE